MGRINTPSSGKEIDRRECIKLGVLGILGLTLSSCASFQRQKVNTAINKSENGKEKSDEIKKTPTKSTEDINPIFRDTDRIERVEVNGDPKIGTVTIIHQIHNTPEMNEDQLVCVGEVQYRILQELKRLRVKDIFSEGATKDFTCGNDDKNDDIYDIVVREIFRDNFERNSTLCVDEELEEYCENEDVEDEPECDFDLIYDERFFENIEDLKTGDSCEQQDYRDKMNLLSQGAGEIYACLEEAGVTVHGLHSSDEELFKKLKKTMLKDIKTEAEYKEWKKEITLLSPEREANATRKVMEFLAKNKGKNVVLIYGSSHTFKDDFEKLENPPLVKLITFPNLLREKYFQITGSELKDTHQFLR